MTHVSVIELYVEFEQIPYVVRAVEEVQAEMEFVVYDNDSEEEFEGNYEISEPNEEDVVEHDIGSNVEDVTNALANELPFQEPSFMLALDVEALNEPDFIEYMNSGPPYVTDEEFAIEMKFNSREAMIKSIKEYTIRRGVDYWVRESEPTIFYAQCVKYGANCDWLIRVSLIK
ncbi:hypothetical protein PIB30_048199 [Stylosanthes scabra]|uniref:Transposase MuDR plant domain-containing protein n=1 Tax=Stylosanthes scabra TaxID=79078 RepID=A0ABU6QH67_9FABA|nr:hypothetical protein [Stylosanthes scabra]